MANPGNPDPNDPRLTDPLNPTRPLGTGDPVIDNRVVNQPRGNSGTWLIALVVVILAIVAYFLFGRSAEAPAPATPPAATESAPAPADGGAMKPAEPAPAPATPPATESAPANPPARVRRTRATAQWRQGGRTWPVPPLQRRRVAARKPFDEQPVSSSTDS